ncbi:MAG: N-acetylmuramoyl-L-alanine amidase, partial [Minicystis sp.]
MGPRRILSLLAVVSALALLGWGAFHAALGLRRVARISAPRPDAVASTSPEIWPGPRAILSVISPRFPADFGVHRVVVDPGHGAAHNRGNTSCFCVVEERFTLGAAFALRDRLEATGHFEVKLSREDEATIEYQERLDEAARFGAEAFVSLHSDIRGKAERWSPDGGASCPISLIAPGFTVLYSDEGDTPLVDRSLALARATARRMLDTGLLAYGGASYQGLYEAVSASPGVFVDRHPREQRIFILREAAMPSVLIETHHALDPREAERWE